MTSNYSYPRFVTGNMDITEFRKKGHNAGTLWPDVYKISHANVHVIGIMCNKFHLDDLETVGGV